jgi:DUF1365 family protein
VTAQSSAYAGRVVHARQRPRAHRLRYSVFYLLLDLAELPALGSNLRLFAYNRAGIFSFHERDHGPRDGSSLRDWVDTQLAEAGIAIPGGQVKLLCLPRILGYVFNPISIFYCFDREGRFKAALYEVSNTFHETHTYLLPVGDGDTDMVHHSFDKKLYVSPFIPMDCRYDIALRNPGDHASIVIRESDAEGDLLAATFHGRQAPLTDRFLAATFVRFPFLTLKVMVGIHWDALKLWVKRTPVFHHPPQPSLPVSIVRSSGSPHDVRVHTD